MPEIEKVLKPIVFSELQPPMNITLVTDEQGLKEFDEWVARKQASEEVPVIGLDTETNIAVDFFYRKARTIQIGDKEKQFVFDLLAFAGSEEVLSRTQGDYGKHSEGVYDSILHRLEPILCSNKWLKVGQGLSFEYTIFHWNLGLRIWNLYSIDMAERVIQAGTLPLKRMTLFSMSAIVGRTFGLLIDKSQQESFDLKTPLTEEQIQYAAFDTRMPLSVRQAQINKMTVDQLLTTAQIENDAIGTFTDMHLVGQNLDDERWLKRLQSVLARRKDELKFLDETFLPLLGHKLKQIDESKIDKLEKIWREGFEAATPREMELASLKRTEKNPE